MPVVLDSQTEARAWSDTISLDRPLGLTSCGASYLELALQQGLPIATLDAPLKASAQAVGVPLYQP